MSDEVGQLSDEARAVLAAGPPPPFTVPISRISAPGLRILFDQPRKERLEASLAAYGGTVTTGAVAGVDVAHLDPNPAAAQGDYLVHLHGGAFVFGNPVDTVVLELSGRTGLPAVSIDYRRSPESVYPRALEETVEVWRELTTTRPGRPVLVATSAGGNLALGLLQRIVQPESGLRQPAAVVLLSPWVDLATGAGPRAVNEGRDPVISWANLLDPCTAAYVGGADLSDPLVSPIHGDYAGLTAPVLVTTGTGDLFHADCLRLRDVLTAAGVRVTLDAPEGLWHVYQGIPTLPESRRSLAMVTEFITAATDLA